MNLKMFLVLGGGLGLFMFGMKMMGEGLERAAGNKMKRFLEILTQNRIMGVIVGTVVTAIIQSSSATTVMLVGFANAGLMNLNQVVGVILGANIGTTITGQMIAFNLSDIAPLAVFIGVGLIFFSKKSVVQRIGEILTGFGLLFIGIDTMSKAMEPLRYSQAFSNLMTQFKNPIVGVLAGFIFTAVVQSSSASIGVLQTLASLGLIGLDSAIFVLFGENIGTCVTALLASIGTNITAKRTAIIHLLIKIIGTIIFVVLILIGVPYVSFMQSITPGNVARQIANAHTGFNIVNTLIMLPAVGYLVSLSKKIIPGKEIDVDEKRLQFLDKRILETPTIAVAQIMKEVGRMGDMARSNVKLAMKAFFDLDEAAIKEVYRQEEIINFLNREITDYLVMANGLDLQRRDLKLIGGLFHVVNDIERVGDHAENLIEYAEYRRDNKLQFSDEGIKELTRMTDMVITMLDNSIEAFKTRDKELARSIEPQEAAIDDIQGQLRDSHIRRLNSKECQPNAGVIYLDIISNLERIADHAINIGYSVLD